MRVRNHTRTHLYTPGNCPSEPYKDAAIRLVISFLFYTSLTTDAGKKIVYTSSVVTAIRPLKR